MVERISKVVAYIVREKEGRRELLVFTHRDYPEAGLQVPAGTVTEGEDVMAAALREVVEETGLSYLGEAQLLSVYDHFNTETGKTNERHVFMMGAPPGLPDSWEWIETDGGKKGEGYVFCFRWADLGEHIELAGGLGDYLKSIL